MSMTPTRTIQNALGKASGPVTSVAQKVRRTLTDDGWRVVKATKMQRLEAVLNELYVDNRRQRQVDLLTEARKIVSSL